MFLPVLLMQWFGWSGFLLIALPNCIGAAAMGLLLGSPSASRRFCRKHPTAIGGFVSVTILFHLIFLSIAATWLCPPGMQIPFGWAIWPAAAAVVAWVLSFAPRGWWPWLGTAAFACGAVVVVTAACQWTDPGWSGHRPAIDLLWLSPVFVVGFLLCPWLDAPFHRARQEVQGPIGPALLAPLFLCMLLVTASYWWMTEGTATRVILVWLAGQSVFTLAANVRECRAGGVVEGMERGGLAAAVLLTVVGGVVLQRSASWSTALQVYLGFLAAYGIAFPAIILAWCRRDAPRPTTPAVVRLTVLLLIAGWLGNFGFITGPTWVAVIPAALVLLTPAIVGRNSPLSAKPLR